MPARPAGPRPADPPPRPDPRARGGGPDRRRTVRTVAAAARGARARLNARPNRPRADPRHIPSFRRNAAGRSRTPGFRPNPTPTPAPSRKPGRNLTGGNFWPTGSTQLLPLTCRAAWTVLAFPSKGVLEPFIFLSFHRAGVAVRRLPATTCCSIVIPLHRITREGKRRPVPWHLKGAVFDPPAGCVSAVEGYIGHHNANDARPFRWSRSPEDPVASCRRGHRRLGEMAEAESPA